MGQTQGQSLRDVVTAQTMQSPHDVLQKHAAELRHMAQLSYNAFLSSISEINKITQSFNDAKGKKLVFQLKDGTTTTIFWKVTARILCHKVNCRTEKTESSRVLTLKQYIRLYNEIAQHVSLVTQPMDTAAAKVADIRASTIFAELDESIVKARTAEIEECCICMDAEAVVILPCVHIYCESCIEKWSADHKTCPVCRAAVSSAGDRWELTETPDATEMSVDMADYLLGVADRSGYATSSAPDN